LPESIHFFAWQDAKKVPETCPLCNQENPIFEYQITPGEGATDYGRELSGNCCLACGQGLLASLQELILGRWSAEDARLEEEDVRKTEE
jgi:hypothetical protein